MTAFWDVASCCLLVVNRRFIVIALMMEALRTSETSAYYRETTRHYIPEGCLPHTHRRENLKCHNVKIGYRLQLCLTYMSEKA